MAGLGQQPDPTPVYSVGEGILRAMQEHGENPASDEVYMKRGEVDEWSEAFSDAGCRYLYLPSVNRVFRYEASS